MVGIAKNIELLNKRYLLGAQSLSCRFINMGNNHWVWVYFRSGSGGGNAPIGPPIKVEAPASMSGLAGCGLAGNCTGCKHKGSCMMLGADEPLYTDIDKWIASWTSDVAFYKRMVAQHPTSAFYKERLTNAQSQLAFWLAQRQKPINELVNIGAGAGFQSEYNNFISSMKNTINKVVKQSDTGFQLSSIGGQPWYIWAALLTAGGAVVYSQTKKKKRV